jgi:hypothetical protein
VLVSRSVLEALQVSATDLRDRHLLSFDPAAIDLLEIAAEEKFTLRRQGSNSWAVTEPQLMLADGDLVRTCLNLLASAEGDVEKDVVTDFAMYGLAPPLRQYSLRIAGTNVSETATNRLVSQLDIGGRRDSKIFARGLEPTVYTVDPILDKLPVAAWQLRDRRVWSFTTNQVTHLTVQHDGSTRRLVRGSAGDWKFAEGSTGILSSTLALEETIYRLGELRATVWVNRGEGKRQLYGFVENGDKLSIELRIGEKTQLLTLEFGGKAPDGYPYAMAVIDDQTWIFEFPLQLYLQVVKGIFNQLPSPTAQKSTAL